MAEDIKSKVQNIDPSIKPRNILELVKDTENIYEALNVINKRSRHLFVDIKNELDQKLEEFAVNSENIEEISENKEQIEISKFYERLPNAATIATEEFLKDELHYYYKDNKRRR